MAMPPITLRLAIFEGPTDRARSGKVLLWFLEALVQTNVLWLGQNPDTPELYKSGARYAAEDGVENWQDIPTILRARSGDCEDLACYRCGELRYAGIAAHPFIRWRKSVRGWIYHALVRWPDGRIEDPSLALGMRGTVYSRPVFVEREGEFKG